MRKQLIACLLLLISTIAFTQGKMDRLLVYGNGFMFGVTEPAGWIADTQNAGKVGANILFFRKGESIDKYKAFIYVKIMQKQDEHIEKDMEYDMEQYSGQHPKMKFLDLSLHHPDSELVAKHFHLKKKINDYVCYVNPGAGQPWMFSAGMNTGKKQATDEEMEAYRKVVSSLLLIVKEQTGSE